MTKTRTSISGNSLVLTNTRMLKGTKMGFDLEKVEVMEFSGVFWPKMLNLTLRNLRIGKMQFLLD